MGVVVNVRFWEANIRELRRAARAATVFDIVWDNGIS